MNTEKKTTLTNDGLLLLTAGIWGFAFVAQRVGMDHIGPFFFNGIRFALGALSLFLLIPLLSPRGKQTAGRAHQSAFRGKTVVFGLIAGCILFLAGSLQQVGMLTTTAGNAGFITSFYVVLVPFLGIFLGKRTNGKDWIGAVLAIAGLYFLSVSGKITLVQGDLLVFASAFFWAVHVLAIGSFTHKADALGLSAVQFSVCSLLSLATAFFTEPLGLEQAVNAAVPILYGGIMSVGLAYTLQVIAQKKAHPSHAAIILSLEGVFAALGGMILLGETMTSRGAFGCLLVLLGTFVSQGIFRLRPDRVPEPRPGEGQT